MIKKGDDEDGTGKKTRKRVGDAEIPTLPFPVPITSEPELRYLPRQKVGVSRTDRVKVKDWSEESGRSEWRLRGRFDDRLPTGAI